MNPMHGAIIANRRIVSRSGPEAEIGKSAFVCVVAYAGTGLKPNSKR